MDPIGQLVLIRQIMGLADVAMAATSAAAGSELCVRGLCSNGTKTAIATNHTAKNGHNHREFGSEYFI